MPILSAEPDCFPDDMFAHVVTEENVDAEPVYGGWSCEEEVPPLRHPLAEQPWWLMYTHSRQEKQLLRYLRAAEVAHYGPMIPKRQRSPAGRMRTSYVPLFSNYVFVMGDDEDRYQAVCSGCVAKVAPITEVEQLVQDLRQIHSLVTMGVPLTIESKIEAGEQVRVRNGVFKGYEGTVIRREGETRLLVAVRFMEQGVSVHLEDCQLEAV